MANRYHVEALCGDHVRLEPLELAHIDGLVRAANIDPTAFPFTTVPTDKASMTSYVAALLEEGHAGTTVPFAQIAMASGHVVGATRFLTIRTLADAPFAVEIGGTWLGASAQRSGINTEAKLLLMGYAFDEWRVARVDFKSDARNRQSRTAIERLGATFEGVLRHWQPSLVVGEESLCRNTAMYSVIDTEWLDVRAHLRAKLLARS
jgi:RimJ/RimL family protein N-acetyltransferase